MRVPAASRDKTFLVNGLILPPKRFSTEVELSDNVHTLRDIINCFNQSEQRLRELMSRLILESD